MAPTIVTRGRQPVLALGSPGGATIITTVLQILVDRLDLGTPLPEAIAAPRASASATRPRARPSRRSSRSPEARRCSTPVRARVRAAAPRAGDEIGAATGIEFLPARQALAAAEPARRGGGAPRWSGPLAKSSSTGSRARASSTTASASASCLDPERAGGDRDDAHVVGARAGDVARRVADHDRALARPVAGARAGDRRQLGARRRRPSRSRPGPARSSGRCPARASLQPRDRLEVAGHQRQAELVRPRRQRGEQLRHARRDAVRQVGRAQLRRRPRRRRATTSAARVDRRRGRRRRRSRSRTIAASVRPAHLDRVAVERRRPWTRAAASRSAGACSPRRAAAACRRCPTAAGAALSAGSPGRARAAGRTRRSACAAFSTSSSCTISTGECM